MASNEPLGAESSRSGPPTSLCTPKQAGGSLQRVLGRRNESLDAKQVGWQPPTRPWAPKRVVAASQRVVGRQNEWIEAATHSLEGSGGSLGGTTVSSPDGWVVAQAAVRRRRRACAELRWVAPPRRPGAEGPASSRTSGPPSELVRLRDRCSRLFLCHSPYHLCLRVSHKDRVPPWNDDASRDAQVA